MNLTTRLKRGHVLRQVIIGIVCVVLGLWGVYDYVYTIPQQQEAHNRYVVASAVVNALEVQPSDEDFQEKHDAALEQIKASASDTKQRIEETVSQSGRTMEELAALSEDELREVFDTGDITWSFFLAHWETALRSPRPTRGTQKLTKLQAQAFDTATAVVNKNAEVSPPAKYDRIMKGLVFIPCLPIGLYMVLMLGIQSRKRYTLNEQGDLELANGQVWKRDDIADVDMRKWMSKSIAFVKHADGSEHKLDDYIHQDMHLIIGALAHRFYPDEWTEDARPVKKEGEGEDEQGAPQDADGDEVQEPAEQPAGVGDDQQDRS